MTVLLLEICASGSLQKIITGAQNMSDPCQHMVEGMIFLLFKLLFFPCCKKYLKEKVTGEDGGPPYMGRFQGIFEEPHDFIF